MKTPQGPFSSICFLCAFGVQRKRLEEHRGEQNSILQVPVDHREELASTVSSRNCTTRDYSFLEMGLCWDMLDVLALPDSRRTGHVA